MFIFVFYLYLIRVSVTFNSTWDYTALVYLLFPPINNTQSPRNPDIIILSKKKNINTTYVRKQGSTISE